MISRNDSPKVNPLAYALRIESARFGRVYVTFMPAGQDEIVLPGGEKLTPTKEQRERVTALGKFLETLSADAISVLRLLNSVANIQRGIGKKACVLVTATVAEALAHRGIRDRMPTLVTWSELLLEGGQQ